MPALTPIVTGSGRHRRAGRLRRIHALAWALFGLAPAGLVAASAPADGSNPTPPATPGEALRHYRRGQYEQSQDQFSMLARERPDDARLRFNAGAAAYRRNDFTNAARWFESVMAAPDLELQQQAYYNLGNTRYRLGEAATDPKARQRLWQEAMTNFTAASKLDGADAQASANLAFIRRKLEELQAQMPPPPPPSQQDQKQDQKEDSENQESQENSDPQSSDSNQGQDPQKNASDPSSQDSPGSSGKSEDSEGKSPEGNPESSSNPGEGKSDANREGSQKGEGSESSDGPGERQEGPSGAAPGEEEGAETAGGAEATGSGDKPGEMTRAQAVQVLEGQKGEEKALMLRSYGGKQSSDRAARVRKPW